MHINCNKVVPSHQKAFPRLVSGHISDARTTIFCPSKKVIYLLKTLFHCRKGGLIRRGLL